MTINLEGCEPPQPRLSMAALVERAKARAVEPWPEMTREQWVEMLNEAWAEAVDIDGLRWETDAGDTE